MPNPETAPADDAQHLLEDLRARGLTVTLDEQNNLVLRPKKRLDDALRGRLRRHKADLVAVLTPQPEVNAVFAVFAQAPETEKNLGDDGAATKKRRGRAGVHPPEAEERRGDALELPPIVHLQTVDDAQDALRRLMRCYAVGLDTEATGVDPKVNHRILLQLAAPDVVYIADADVVDWRVFQPLLDHGPLIVGHNLKFECRMLMAAGLRLPDRPRFFDTSIASRLLEATAGPRLFHGLEDGAARYLGIHLDKGAQLSFRHGPKTDLQYTYAARDALVCLPLHQVQRRLLAEAGLETIAEIEMDAICTVAWLEDTGAPIDVAGWEKQADAMKEERRVLEGRLSQVAGESILWTSPKQVARVLEERGHTLPLTDKGNKKTGKDALFTLPESEPLRSPLLDFALLKSVTQTYGHKFLDYVHPVTGRLHGDWHQLGSEAGRMSCTRVILQGIPRRDAYRRLIRAPEGHVLVKCDYAHIEFDLCCQIARDPRGLALLERKEDPHKRTAAELMRKPMEEVTKPERQKVKPVVFGLLYGMGPATLVEYAKESYGVDLPFAVARQWHRGFFRYYVGIRGWHKAFADGPIATRTILGRRRLDVSVFMDKANTPVQGSGADGLKLALRLLWRHRHRVPSLVPVIAAHDELVVQCTEEDAAAAEALVSTIMLVAMKRVLTAVEPVVESGVFYDWGVTPVPGLKK